jgi:hypothetical protein
MPDTPASVLASWSSFYVMTGSSAAALTGLMFIVITLVTNVERARRSREGTSAFSTPTVVHFCAAFFVSAALSAPWRAFAPAAVLLGVVSAAGAAYVLHVMLRQLRFVEYQPDVEDFTFYTLLPMLAYVAILAGALLLLTLGARATDGLYAVAAAVVLLILIGIHNAWDLVTFLAIIPPDDPPATP